MKNKELLNDWLHEEELAHIHGWDFSHIQGRFEEGNDLPWNYETIIKKYLKPDMKILDIDTGGGEFILSLGHPYSNIAAMESYPPNVQLCKETLIPLGIDLKEADGTDEHYPFADHQFDMVINRHGSFNAKEIARVLAPGGIFITQQVGAENDRALVQLILNEVPPIPFPNQYLSIIKETFENADFQTLNAQECFCPIKFWDVGALVWFAHIIEWEFPGFDVRKCLDQLYMAQKILEENGVIEGLIHRFLLVAKKL